MTESLNRDQIIALLERLGGDNDADVLDAARALHAAVDGADTSWDDLLAPEDGGTAEADSPSAAEAEPPVNASGRNAEALAVIDKLLARSGITEDFREEMAGYRHDIAEGDFADADLKYLRALDKRLSGKG